MADPYSAFAGSPGVSLADVLAQRVPVATAPATVPVAPVPAFQFLPNVPRQTDAEALADQRAAARQFREQLAAGLGGAASARNPQMPVEAVQPTLAAPAAPGSVPAATTAAAANRGSWWPFGGGATDAPDKAIASRQPEKMSGPRPGPSPETPSALENLVNSGLSLGAILKVLSVAPVRSQREQITGHLANMATALHENMMKGLDPNNPADAAKMQKLTEGLQTTLGHLATPGYSGISSPELMARMMFPGGYPPASP